MCQHKTCANIRINGGKNGVAAAILNFYNGNTTPVILLGKERGGAYTGQYNLIAGKLDKQDNGCYIVALKRELAEEVKLDNLSQQDNFDYVFKMSNGKMRVIMYGGTPIFIGIYNGLSRAPLNSKITACISPTVPWHLQEIELVDWFRLDNHSQLEGTTYQVSIFADAVMTRIWDQKLYV